MARAEVRADALVNWEGTNIQHAHDQRHLPWLVFGSVDLLASGIQKGEIDDDGLIDEMGLLSVIDSIWGASLVHLSRVDFAVLSKSVR